MSSLWKARRRPFPQGRTHKKILVNTVLQSASNCKPGLQPVKRILSLKHTPAGITQPAEPTIAYVCAASAPDPDTILHGLIAVKAQGKQEQQHAIRFLADTERYRQL